MAIRVMEIAPSKEKQSGNSFAFYSSFPGQFSSHPQHFLLYSHNRNILFMSSSPPEGGGFFCSSPKKTILLPRIKRLIYTKKIILVSFCLFQMKKIEFSLKLTTRNVIKRHKLKGKLNVIKTGRGWF